jgi:hypothetical protein
MHSLVLSARLNSDVSGLDISTAEAELLGWLAGDGSIYPPGVNGRGTAVTLWQSKPHRVAEIETLLATIGCPFSRYERGNRGHEHHHDSFAFYLHARYSADLLRRAEFERGWESMVLAMSDPQRKAWLEGMIAAEGCMLTHESDIMRIPQNDGPIAEAIALAVYLEGFRPSRRRPRGGFSNVTMARPQVRAGSLTVDEHSVEPVWCVNTDLGTWTMRQGEQIMLTGNSTWATVGGTKTSDPYLQGVYGQKYIAQRYGDPASAWAFWQAQSPHWYDQGGEASGIGVMFKNVLRPERVLNPSNTETFNSALPLLESINASAWSPDRLNQASLATQSGSSGAAVGHDFSVHLHEPRVADVNDLVDVAERRAHVRQVGMMAAAPR